MRAGNARPYDIVFCAGKDITHGTGKPVPYKGRRNTVERSLTVYASVTTPGCRNMRIGRSVISPLKDVDLADEEVLAGEDGFFKAAAVGAIALVLDDVI